MGFPDVSEGPLKNRNVKLIKIARNSNRAKRNCHTSFFVCEFKNSKSVPIDSELNSAPGNQTHFLMKSGRGTWKSSQTSKSGPKFEKNDLWHRKAQDRHMVGPNRLHIRNARSRVGNMGRVSCSFRAFKV